MARDSLLFPRNFIISACNPVYEFRECDDNKNRSYCPFFFLYPIHLYDTILLFTNDRYQNEIGVNIYKSRVFTDGDYEETRQKRNYLSERWGRKKECAAQEENGSDFISRERKSAARRRRVAPKYLFFKNNQGGVVVNLSSSNFFL